MSAISPQDWQDQQDGAALRRASMVDGGWTISNVRAAGRTVGYAAEAWSHRGKVVKVLGFEDEGRMPPTFQTIAEAVDAIQAALEGAE